MERRRSGWGVMANAGGAERGADEGRLIEGGARAQIYQEQASKQASSRGPLLDPSCPHESAPCAAVPSVLGPWGAPTWAPVKALAPVIARAQTTARMIADEQR